MQGITPMAIAAICASLLLAGVCPTQDPPQKKAAVDVEIVVFRHHPGIIDTKERMQARDDDETVIFAALKNRVIAIRYVGGLGRGYQLSLHASDQGTWKSIIDELHKAK